MSPDPGGLKVVRLDNPQTWNMYAYVRNNPTTLTDPSGLGVLDNLWPRVVAGLKELVGSPSPPSALPPVRMPRAQGQQKNNPGGKPRPIVQGQAEKMQVYRGGAQRVVYYQVVNKNGKPTNRRETLTLHEEFTSGEGNANICNGEGGCKFEGGTAKDQQEVIDGKPYSITRTWQVGTATAGVRDPDTGVVHDREVLSLDYNNVRSNPPSPPIETKYQDDP